MYGIEIASDGFTFFPLAIPDCTIEIFSRLSTFHPFGLVTGSPNISRNVDRKSSSVSRIASFRFRRIASALSKIAAIRFCSSRGGRGIFLPYKLSLFTPGIAVVIVNFSKLERLRA